MCKGVLTALSNNFKTYLGKQLYVFHTPSIIEISKIQTFVQNVLAKHKNPSTSMYWFIYEKNFFIGNFYLNNNHFPVVILIYLDLRSFVYKVNHIKSSE